MPRSRRLDTKEARGLAALHAAPEFFLRRQQEVLVEGIGRDGDLDPFAATGNDREHGRLGIGDPHIVLDLRHVLFGRRFFRERPGQHELGLKHGPGLLDDAVKRRSHPSQHRMSDVRWTSLITWPALRSYQMPIEGLGYEAELNDQVAGQVLRFSLAALFPPEAKEGRFVRSHDDAGIGAADEMLSIIVFRLSKLDLVDVSFLRPCDPKGIINK